MSTRVVWTIGHSTRSSEELFAILQANDIQLLADVRRFPTSQRHPQFNRGALEPAAQTAGMRYEWIEDLGGRRSTRKDSHNTAWRNASFRGYADYMETEPFARAVAALRERADRQRVVIMCAERAWQQCHRGLIADYLRATGDEVLHILGDARIEPHPYTAAARIVEGKLSYEAPSEPAQGNLDF